MIVTDEIREYARKHYGAAMPDYLAAIDRIAVPGEYGVMAENAPGGEDAVQVAVEEPGVMFAYAYDMGESVALTPALALRSGWDLIAMADALRHGWIREALTKGGAA